MINVLVTCVGSGVGQSVIDSLNLKRDYKIVGCDGNRNVYAHSYCDEFYEVSSLYSEGYVNEIASLCIENDIDILIPGHDHELILFAENLEIFESKGTRVLVSEPIITEISRDKQNWYHYFNSRGCKIVPTLSVKEFKANIDSSIFPAIVKPSGGSASQGISIINKIEDLKGLKEEDIIQPYLFPEKEDSNYEAIKIAVSKGDFIQKSEISIQLIFNDASKHVATFISKNTLKNGVPIFVDPINPKTFKYLNEILKFVPILEKGNVKGPVNIQGRITPQGLYFFEMNMRFTGITGNRAFLGFNEVDYLVRNFLKKPANLGGYALNKLGVRQVACTTIERPKNQIKKKTVTILGAGSSIGSFYLKNLDLTKYSKIYLVSRNQSIKKYKKEFSQEIFNIISVEDSQLSTCFTKTDILINFVSALAFEKDVLKYNAIRYIYKMLPKIVKAKIPLVINISSQSVYNQRENSCKTEESAIQITNSYAFQKILIEDFMLSIKEYNVFSKVVNLRLPRILNPNNIKQIGFFGTIVSSVINEKKILITNNNTNIIHVNDVRDVINFVIDKGIEDSVLNVSGENISIKEYCAEVEKQLAISKSTINFSEDSNKKSSMINAGKLLNYGWKPEFKLSNIVFEIINTIKDA